MSRAGPENGETPNATNAGASLTACVHDDPSTADATARPRSSRPPVTDRPKRYKAESDRPKLGEYVSVCAACNDIYFTLRRDSITCSGACRVRLHRHPDRLDRLARSSQLAKVEIATILRATAVHRVLGDDAANEMMAGTLSMGDAQDRARAVVVKRLLDRGAA